MRYINARRLRELLISGSRWLSKHSEILDSLNVYPVPDGDTGTNMSMTVKEIEKTLLKGGKELSVDEISKVVSEAVMLGARGNSGTILSQIVYGFLKGLLGKERISVKDIASAIDEARKSAYNSVSSPVEGTILTVVRRLAEEAIIFSESNNDLIKMMEHLKKVAAAEVEKTQETLPKLKEAGVVDAGAKGFYYFLEGFEKVVKGEAIASAIEESMAEKELTEIFDKISGNEITYKYCTEFIIESDEFDLDNFKSEMENFGDSLVTARISGKTKAHVHTNSPGLVLEYAMGYGQLNKIKIENMAIQNNEISKHDNNDIKKEDKKIEDKISFIKNENQNEKIKFVSVAETPEMGELFIKKGAAAFIIGGQSNNPSVAEIENCLKEIKYEKIYFLPNNKNIIPVGKLVQERSNGKIEMLETKSMTEGFYYLENRFDNIEVLIEEAENNITVEITKAVKETTIMGREIKKGDFIFLINGRIEYAGGDASKLLNDFIIRKKDLTISSVTVFSGEEIISGVSDYINTLKEKMIVEEYKTNQSNYYYYLYFQIVSPAMSETIIVTDSTADLNIKINDLPIAEVPLKVKFVSGYYKENFEITKKEFWKKVLTEDIIPKTSQPAPLEFKETYNRLFKKGYKNIISIHISSKLSGTTHSASVGKGMSYHPENITIIDSLTASMAQGHLVIEAARMALGRIENKHILKWIEEEKKKVKIYFIVKDIKYLEKGGRIGKAASILGGLLNIKPVLHVVDGEVVAVKKAIGEKGAIDFILEKLMEKNVKKQITGTVGIGGNEAENVVGFELKNKLTKSNMEIQENFDIGAVIGSHTGGVIGVVFWDS